MQCFLKEQSPLSARAFCQNSSRRIVIAFFSILFISNIAFETACAKPLPSVVVDIAVPDQGTPLKNKLNVVVYISGKIKAVSATVECSKVEIKHGESSLVVSNEVEVPLNKVGAVGNPLVAQVPLTIFKNGQYIVTLTIAVVAPGSMTYSLTRNISILAEDGRVWLAPGSSIRYAAEIMIGFRQGLAKTTDELFALMPFSEHLSNAQFENFQVEFSSWAKRNGAE